MHIVLVGAGFAGAILARVGHALGHEVTLVERGSHPRFALGESSTPLAALALERLAARYGLADLDAMAAHGRWTDELPGVRHGLKRGFTFYRHTTGESYGNDAANRARLLVAASPNDAVADTHWFREDVDAHLTARAVAEGVRYFDRTTIVGAEERREGMRLALEHDGAISTIDADFVVDGSGAAGTVATHVGSASASRTSGLRTGLVYGHFEGVAPLTTVAAAADFPAGPYPDERAAVHHLLDEGWMYELRFDHGVTSAGFVLEKSATGPTLDGAPEAVFNEMLSRYPSLAAQYAGATPVRPLAILPHLQWRRTRAAGTCWALLPHTYSFSSPLYSTGIAWSLVAVERLALALDGNNLPASLDRYARLLELEADHLDAFVRPAYAARGRFDVFDAVSQVYFAAASCGEAEQRLTDPPPRSSGHWAWTGFLGADDPAVARMVQGAARLSASGGDVLAEAARLIAPHNVAGFADASKQRLYPVDLNALVAGASRLGLDEDTVCARLARLRG